MLSTAPSFAPTYAPTLRCADPFTITSPTVDDTYKVGDTLSVRYTANASCTADFVCAMLCVVDPQVHVSGTVGACYHFGDKAAHRNDGEIDFAISAAIAEGGGFYRVRIADKGDANLRVFSGIIEIVGVIAEGVSAPTAATADRDALQKETSEPTSSPIQASALQHSKITLDVSEEVSTLIIVLSLIAAVLIIIVAILLAVSPVVRKSCNNCQWGDCCSQVMERGCAPVSPAPTRGRAPVSPVPSIVNEDDVAEIVAKFDHDRLLQRSLGDDVWKIIEDERNEPEKQCTRRCPQISSVDTPISTPAYILRRLVRTSGVERGGTVFLSYRMSSDGKPKPGCADAEARYVRAGLEERGVTVLPRILDGSASPEAWNDDRHEEIAKAVARCDLFVFLGTMTYGERTPSLMCTFYEFTFALQENKPLAWIKFPNPIASPGIRMSLPPCVYLYMEWQRTSALIDWIQGKIPNQIPIAFPVELIDSPTGGPNRVANIRNS